MFKKAALFFLVLALCEPDCGQARQETLSFTSSDRVLILAPHPDDETLGLGGMLQRLRASGAQVRILYLTHGESNEVASIFYQKRPLLWRSDFVKSGLTRKKEALGAMALLGFKAEELIFFGYPDGGLMNMWIKHWGEVSRPFRSLFTRFSRVPYKDNFSAGHVFKADEVVRDLERALLSFQPTAVFVTAPFDLNTDHQAAFLYAQVALRDLREQLMPPPSLYVYLVHAHHWPEPKKLQTDAPLDVPTHIDWGNEVAWKKFPLTDEETKKKVETLLQYKSQLAYKKNFLLAFARKNELYAVYPAEKIQRITGAEPGSGSFADKALAGDVRYRVAGDELWIEIPFSSALDEMGVLSSYVFGYRSGFLFSDMPKFAFRLFGNKVFVYDGQKSFYDRKLIYRIEKDKLLIRLPLGILKEPEALFVSTRNAKEELSLDFGAWKVLEIAP